uniref:transmembrane protein 184A-like n=1 Tax=Erigeron canadensis TaxID=72917 RepID=UPI001CB94791|nr:transmembrane protein 184A-like [Erigeron canadensis]
MWFDDMVTTIHPLIYSGIPLAYPIYSAAHNIQNHRSHWAKPEEQKRILVLVAIPAVIGIVSWAELHVNEDRKTIFLLLDSIKECSAGLSIPMFMGLLQAYMNLNTSKLSPDAFRQKIRGRLVYNVFPVTLVQPRCVTLNQHNLELMNLLTWQYVAVRLVCTIFMIAFQRCDMYPLWLSWMFFFILNVSASVAYYTACAFYLAFVEDFPRLSYGKFLHIRGIFFFCFWQGGVFKILVAMGLMKRNHFWRQELHNTLLVLETTPLSFTHWVAYSAGVYIVFRLPLKSSVPSLMSKAN